MDEQSNQKNLRRPILLKPKAGRDYSLGRGRALFLADGEETPGYSISEWWLEPHTKGPGAHSHPEDDAFFVLEGTMTFFVGDRWFEAPAGSFVLAPGGVDHDFQNRGDVRAGMINFSNGHFEEAMPAIAEWFQARAPEDAELR